ncbi:hypothetical protein BV898_19826, partial [Hypsibius exemplaris]
FLAPGESLHIGQVMWSPNRTTQLRMQADGNLVVYRECDHQAIWNSGTNYNNSHARSVRMEANGNLVIYDIDDKVLWASGTDEKHFAGAQLRLEDAGSLCIEQTTGLCLWRSGGIALCHPAYAPTFEDAQVILRSGESLTPGKTVWSNSGSCTLTLQTDGEMLLNRQCDGATIFSIRRYSGNPESMGADMSLSAFTMNETGCLFMARPCPNSSLSYSGNLILWPGESFQRNDTVYSRQKTCRLSAQSDGNLVVTRTCDGEKIYSVKNDTAWWNKRAIVHRLGIEVNGNLTMYAEDNWWTYDMRNDRVTPDGANLRLSVLESGEALFVGRSLWSPGRNVQLKMEWTGDLAIYRQCDNKSIWSSKTSDYTSKPRSVVMQENGNLAIYNGNGLLVWSSGTFQPRFGGAKLRLQDTGSLCIYTQGECLWESGGFGLCQPTPSPAFQNGT